MHASVAEYEAKQAKKREEANYVSPEKQELGYEPGFFERNGLNKWPFMVPTSIAIFFPFMENQWFVINEEVSLAIAWAMFCGGIYVKFGDTIADMFKASRQEIVDQQTGYEGAVIDSLKEMIEASESETDSISTFNDVVEVTRDLERRKAQAEMNEEMASLRMNTLRRLDALVAAEETALQSLRGEMVNFVIDHATNHFTNDKKAREDALKVAIASIGSNKPIGKDVVGAEMVKGVKLYKKQAEKGQNAALVQLEQQIETILKA